MRALVAYYSRTGSTRRAAEAVAEALRAGAQVEVEEIRDRKNRAGLLGWLGAGRDAVLGRGTGIEPVRADPGAFGLVVVGTPVWAWTAAPAARAFLEKHVAGMKRVAFLCTMGGSGAERTFRAMERACGRAPVATLALLERDVKRPGAEAFGARVEAFAKALLRPAGG